MLPTPARITKSAWPHNSMRGPSSTSFHSTILSAAGEIAGYVSRCRCFQAMSSCDWPCATSFACFKSPVLFNLVGFNGHPAALPDEEIEAVRQGLTEQWNVQPHPYLKVGRRVRVVSGPLTGLEGIIVRKKNHLRFVISLNLIMRSVSVELDDADVVPTP